MKPNLDYSDHYQTLDASILKFSLFILDKWKLLLD